MERLVIYDEVGYLISASSNTIEQREPVGVPFLKVEIPEGKRIKIDENGIGVDVSVTPHQVILEDIPPSEVDILKDENLKIKESMAELAELILGGM